jgi:hypothetical protein
MHDESSRQDKRATRALAIREVDEVDDSDPELISEPILTLWPGDIGRLCKCMISDGVAFRDVLVDLNRCSCSGACFRDRCKNASASVYCDWDNCAARLGCGNLLEKLVCLRLIPTHTDLGVTATVPLPPEIVVSEYCGVLRSRPAFTQEMRRAGFALEFRRRVLQETTSSWTRVDLATCSGL